MPRTGDANEMCFQGDGDACEFISHEMCFQGSFHNWRHRGCQGDTHGGQRSLRGWQIGECGNMTHKPTTHRH